MTGDGGRETGEIEESDFKTNPSCHKALWLQVMWSGVERDGSRKDTERV